jgi:hypothetical protein
MLLVGESRHVSDHIQHGIAKVNSKNCARKQNESNGKSTTAGVQPFTLLCIYIYISLLLLNYGIKTQSIMGLSADVG